MSPSIEYSPRERAALAAVAIVTLVGLNGAFLYGWLRAPGALTGALANPISVAFIAEALLLTGLLAWLLARWGVSRRSWRWLVVLALLGGLGFALPVVLLWGPGTRK